MKLKIAINNRWTGEVIFEFETENNTIAKTISEYVRIAAENLSGANLSGANLSGANLSDANLSDANLSDADLRRANLRRANLRRANLSDANLSDADLSDANLSGANLSGANLSDANLRSIKADFFLILLYAQHEVAGLKQALIEGKIDGSTYSGDCCCLVGTLANVKGCSYLSIPGILPDAGRPAERWFIGIKQGHTPENNNQAKITLEWIEEFELLTAKAH